MAPGVAVAEAYVRAGYRRDATVRGLSKNPSAFDGWAPKWRARPAEDGGDPNERRSAMRAVNPRFIPRNHLVEEAMVAAVAGDCAPIDRLTTSVFLEPITNHRFSLR